MKLTGARYCVRIHFPTTVHRFWSFRQVLHSCVQLSWRPWFMNELPERYLCRLQEYDVYIFEVQCLINKIQRRMFVREIYMANNDHLWQPEGIQTIHRTAKCVSIPGHAIQKLLVFFMEIRWHVPPQWHFSSSFLYCLITLLAFLFCNLTFEKGEGGGGLLFFFCWYIYMCVLFFN